MTSSACAPLVFDATSVVRRTWLAVTPAPTISLPMKRTAEPPLGPERTELSSITRLDDSSPTIAGATPGSALCGPWMMKLLRMKLVPVATPSPTA